MTHQQIIEGNRLIALFMGYKADDLDETKFWLVEGSSMLAMGTDYTQDWNHLMTVVEKMEKMGYCMDINPWEIVVLEYNSGDETTILMYDIDSELSKIENWWNVLVAFIKWYNQQS